jgi:predicted ATPase/DNA-binding SARP family transcriptional activator
MAHLSLSLLGPFQAWTANGTLQSFRTQKERALLSFLAVESNRPHRRDELAELFWPDRSEGIARNNLRQALYGIRQAVGEAAFDSIFTISTDEVHFNLSDRAWLDIAAFDMHLQSSRNHNHSQVFDCSNCLQHLRDAVEIYRGSFLEDVYLEKNQEFNHWIDFHREQYFQQEIEALEALVDAYEQTGEYSQAVIYARRQVQLDDLEETYYRRLMRLLANNGRNSAALEQYDACRKRLIEVLGKEPEVSTYELAEVIRAGRYDPVVLTRQDMQHNLPEQLTPFFGREMELVQLARFCENPSHRLITLTGPGGVGKTRLAVQAGYSNLRVFPNGVYFVPLECVTTKENLIEAIANAVGLAIGGQPDIRSSLFQYLRSQHMLIVLDNFEHLQEQKEFLLETLQAAPFVKLIVTSRERLNYQVEQVLVMAGLPYPGRDAPEMVGHSQTLKDDLDQYAAVRLFHDRADRVLSNGTEIERVESAAEQEALVRICQVVDGLPLGIELAASWARDFSYQQIAIEVQRSLEFLQTSYQDIPERHRSLRAAFEHSWDLLTESEREVFCKLSVFPGSFTASTAQVIAGAATPWLLRLEDKSLLRRAGYGRFDLHPLLRQFASQKLRLYSRRIEDQALQQHAQLFVTFLKEREIDLKGRRQADALDEIELELENIRAAWDWAVEHQAIDLLDQGAFSLFFFNEARSRWREGEDQFSRAAGRLSESVTSPAARRVLAYLLACQGWFNCRLTKFDQARALLQESLSLLSGFPSDFAQLFVHFAIGFLSVWMGNFSDALRHLSTSLSISSQIGEVWGLAWSRELLAEMAFESGRSGFHGEPFQETLALFERMGEQRGIGRVLNYLGNIAMGQNQLTSAQMYFERMLNSLEKIGDVWGAASGYSKLARLSSLGGNFERAWVLDRQALVLVQKTGDQRRTGYILGELGEISAALNQGTEAEGSFHQALDIAFRTRNLSLALEIFTGIASALLVKNETDRAVHLLRLVLTDGGADPLTISRARKLMESAQGISEMPAASQPPVIQPAVIWEQVEELYQKGIGL